ncbi:MULTISPECIES: APC family permease [unclassified Granulicatella]|uniref:APC family permease n=1 Tax=unclassified Granulicatella TaxID=2630493 RepID=UPI0010733819|nr:MULTISPECIES: amino acid permease [unclassified Granulicatella]MBF0780720.1 amino acid permease [Granulicatella sp. 19428wC4_WM01]TFU94182.1 amino acid permease [Granulicatella sp. WM01]
MKNKKTLQRTIGFTTGFSALVGTVIGAGIFFKPTAVFQATESASLGLLAWLLSGLITIAGGMTVAELGVLFPKTGGMIVYLEEVYGQTMAFLAGWVQMIVYFPGNIAAISIIFGTQFVALFGLDIQLILPIAIFTCLFIMGINILGNKYSGKVQNIFTFLKFIPIILITIFGIMQPQEMFVQNIVSTTTQLEANTFVKLGAGILATLFAYDGWLNIGNLAGEIKDPHKNIPKVILLGVGLVSLVYVLINVAYLMVATPNELAHTATPAALVAERLFAGIGGKLVTIGILVSVFGGLNGYTMAAIRIPYTLAQRKWLPASDKISHIHPKTHISLYSCAIILGMSLLLMLSGTFDSLTNLVVTMIYMFMILTFFTVIILRRKMPHAPRSYKVPLYPIVPIIAILGGIFIVVNTLIIEPYSVLYGVGLTLLGLPLYWIAQVKNSKK